MLADLLTLISVYALIISCPPPFHFLLQKAFLLQLLKSGTELFLSREKINDY